MSVYAFLLARHGDDSPKKNFFLKANGYFVFCLLFCCYFALVNLFHQMKILRDAFDIITLIFFSLLFVSVSC